MFFSTPSPLSLRHGGLTRLHSGNSPVQDPRTHAAFTKVSASRPRCLFSGLLERGNTSQSLNPLEAAEVSTVILSCRSSPEKKNNLFFSSLRSPPQTCCRSVWVSALAPALTHPIKHCLALRVVNAVNYGGLRRLEEQRDAPNKHLASDPSQQVPGSGRPKDGAVAAGPAVAAGATGRSPPADTTGR